MAGENEEQAGQAQRGLGEIGRARASVAAVEAAERLSQPGYLGTEQDWQDLRGWAGWGPLARAFATNPEGTWAQLQARLLAVLGPHEYQHAIEATPNAFYTPPEVASAMLDVLGEFGFSGGRVIEPGCGAGVFLAHEREDIAWHGVERDPTTARIAALLHPHAQVRAHALEDAALPLSTAAVGNVPFENTRVHDRSAPAQVTSSLHAYAVHRAVNALAPGGVAVLLTSRYLLDGRGTAARFALSQQADLLGALRLPNGALASGGTDVPVDLVVLRKRLPDEPVPSESQVPWLQSQPHPACNDEPINAVFHEHPEWVLGELGADQGFRYGHTVRVAGSPSAVPEQLRWLGGQLAEQARAAGRQLQAPNLLPSQQGAAPDEVSLADAQGRLERSFHIGEDGAAYQVLHGQLAPVLVTDSTATKQAKKEARERGEDPEQVASVQVPLGGKSLRELTALVGLREAAVALMDAEADHARPDEQLAPLRAELNAHYDAYVAEFGRLNRATVTSSSRPASRADADQDADAQTGLVKITRRRPSMGGFRADPDYPLVLSLEEWDSATETGSKAAIFHRRVNTPHQRATTAGGPEQALRLCLDETGRVDLDRIAELLDCEASAVPGQLGELAYEDPGTGRWLPREEYTSGEVVDALRIARAAAEHEPDRFARNVAALEAVQPEPIPPESITASLGASWIPPEVVEQFCRDVLEQRVEVTYTPRTAEWDLRSRSPQVSVAATSQYGTHRAPGTWLVAQALAGKTATITDTDETDRRVTNVRETQAAQEKQSLIREEFSRWCWQDPQRAERLAAIYNARFNTRRPRQFSGQHLSFPGMDPEFTPYQHQREMVHRITASPTALCGHPVGAGKTATMFMAALKLREQGLAQKPLIIVPNHLLEQVAADGKRLFPSARILMADEEQLGSRGDPTRRRLFAARCATGDWDAVVMTHSAFEQLPVSTRTQAEFLAERSAELEQEYREQDSTTKRSAKSLGKALKRQNVTLNSHLAARDDTSSVTFEMLGVDYVMVDEAHYFKNLHLHTRAEGVQLPRGSNRATDLDNKLAYLRRTSATGRIGTFFTGTPLSNNVLEMYVLQHYLQPERLREMGVEHLDAYVGTFVRTEPRLEVATDGVSFRSKTRPVGYRNTPELMSAFGEVADVRTESQIGLPRPEVASENVVVPATRVQQDYIAEIGRRIDNRTKEDNMLKICGDGRKCALDPQLVGLDDPEPSKIDAAVARMAAIYHDNAARVWPDGRRGGLQLAFLDQGTPDPHTGREGLYGVIRDGLVAAGVPREQVRFIHEATTQAQKATLFAQARSGEIAVLLGSTDKMGVGTNVQDLVVALHHLDPPWRPADVAQRDGRGIRRGNQMRELGEPVQVLRYITEGSFDSYMWQTLERKARFIAQLFSGEPSREDVDLDLDETVLAASEAKALATGNPLLMDHAEAKQELTRLQRLRDSHQREQRALVDDIATAQDQQQRHQAEIRQLTQRVTTANQHPPGWRYREAELPADQVNATLAQLLTTAMTETDPTRLARPPQLSYRGVDLAFRARKTDRGWQCQVIPNRGTAGVIEVSPRWLSASNQYWRLARAITDGIDGADGQITELQERITELQQRIDRAEAERGRPFPQADELHSAQARLDDLTARINATQTDPDSTADDDQEQPASGPAPEQAPTTDPAEHEPTPEPATAADSIPPDPDTASQAPQPDISSNVVTAHVGAGGNVGTSPEPAVTPTPEPTSTAEPNTSSDDEGPDSGSEPETMPTPKVSGTSADPETAPVSEAQPVNLVPAEAVPLPTTRRGHHLLHLSREHGLVLLGVREQYDHPRSLLRDRRGLDTKVGQWEKIATGHWRAIGTVGAAHDAELLRRAVDLQRRLAVPERIYPRLDLHLDPDLSLQARSLVETLTRDGAAVHREVPLVPSEQDRPQDQQQGEDAAENTTAPDKSGAAPAESAETVETAQPALAPTGGGNKQAPAEHAAQAESGEQTMLERALAWHDAGVAVIPLATDGSKSPLVAWTQYQQQQPTRGQVVEWFQNGHPAMGLVCGSVSEDLELIEFEGRAVEEGLPDQWEQALAAEGHEELYRRVAEQGLMVRSPSGGLHMLVRVDGGVESNRKLASRQARPDELTDEEQQRWNERGVWPRRVLAETRGERGYVVAAGSHGSTHPTGRSWDLVTGSPATIPRISAEERDVLHTAARGLDQLPAPAPTPEPAPSARRHDAEQGLTPGADFNARGSWAEVLEPEGWIRVREHANGATAWRRPGKNLGVSALTGGPAGDYLFVFSTSTELPAETALSRFRAYALTRHGGDFSAAARALRRAGYGATEPPATSSSARQPEQPHAQTATEPAAPEAGSDEPGPTVVLSYRQDTGVLLTSRDGAHDLGEVFDQAKRQGFQPGNWRYSASITTATGQGAHYILGSRNRPITATILDRIATSAEQLRRSGYTVELDIALDEIADDSRREQRAAHRALDRLGLTLDEVQTTTTAPTISAAETAAPEQHDTDAPDTAAPAQAESGSPAPIANSTRKFPHPADAEAADDTPSTGRVEQPAPAEDAEPALFPAEPAAPTAAAQPGIPPREQITTHLRRLLQDTLTSDRIPADPPRQFLGRLREATTDTEQWAVTTVQRLRRDQEVTAFERGQREAASTTPAEREHMLRTMEAIGELLAEHELDYPRTYHGNPMGNRPGETLGEAIDAYLAGARGEHDPYPPLDPDMLDSLSPEAINTYLLRTGWTKSDDGHDIRIYDADPTNPGEADADHQLHVHATPYAPQTTLLIRKLARVEQRPAEQVLAALAAEPTGPDPDATAAITAEQHPQAASAAISHAASSVPDQTAAGAANEDSGAHTEESQRQLVLHHSRRDGLLLYGTRAGDQVGDVLSLARLRGHAVGTWRWDRRRLTPHGTTGAWYIQDSRGRQATERTVRTLQTTAAVLTQATGAQVQLDIADSEATAEAAQALNQPNRGAGPAPGSEPICRPWSERDADQWDAAAKHEVADASGITVVEAAEIEGRWAVQAQTVIDGHHIAVRMSLAHEERAQQLARQITSQPRMLPRLARNLAVLGDGTAEVNGEPLPATTTAAELRSRLAGRGPYATGQQHSQQTDPRQSAAAALTPPSTHPEAQATRRPHPGPPPPRRPAQPRAEHGPRRTL